MAQQMKTPSSTAHRVPGWGADLSPRNRPAVPKEKPSSVRSVRGVTPPSQFPKVKIHLSTEHPGLPPVFGTSCPPRWVSGKIRDFAYRYSEGRARHWLLLLFADRVDVMEAVVADLLRGKLPNPVKEMGLKSELARSNRARLKRGGLLLAVALGALAVTAIGARRIRRA